jgi:hypothetical protein
LADIERAIRASWSRETCDPVDGDVWSPENPSRGQCAVTALVVQDLLGGELLLAEVHYADGSRQGLHYWNRLGEGVELDLTREQFQPDEIVQPAKAIDRPADLTTGRLYPQYQALSRAVRAGLGGEILHITTRAEWEAARAAGRYAPPWLAAEGFIYGPLDVGAVARVVGFDDRITR